MNVTVNVKHGMDWIPNPIQSFFLYQSPRRRESVRLTIHDGEGVFVRWNSSPARTWKEENERFALYGVRNYTGEFTSLCGTTIRNDQWYTNSSQLQLKLDLGWHRNSNFNGKESDRMWLVDMKEERDRDARFRMRAEQRFLTSPVCDCNEHRERESIVCMCVCSKFLIRDMNAQRLKFWTKNWDQERSNVFRKLWFMFSMLMLSHYRTIYLRFH